MELIFESIFFSFPIFIIGSFLASLSNNAEFKSVNEQLKVIAFKLLSFAGLGYLILWTIPLIINNPDEAISYEGFNGLYRAVGPYWFLYLATLFVYIIMPQLLWIKKIRNSKIFIWLLTLSIIFILNFERFLIMVTSIHRDYVPSKWSYNINQSTIIGWIIAITIFLLALIIFYLYKRKTRHNKG